MGVWASFPDGCLGPDILILVFAVFNFANSHRLAKYIKLNPPRNIRCIHVQATNRPENYCVKYTTDLLLVFGTSYSFVPQHHSLVPSIHPMSPCLGGDIVMSPLIVIIICTVSERAYVKLCLAIYSASDINFNAC